MYCIHPVNSLETLLDSIEKHTLHSVVLVKWSTDDLDSPSDLWILVRPGSQNRKA